MSFIAQIDAKLSTFGKMFFTNLQINARANPFFQRAHRIYHGEKSHPHGEKSRLYSQHIKQRFIKFL